MQNQKKILFLASWYPSKEQPTLGNFVQKHAELANEIAEVHVLYATSSSHVDDFTIDSFVVNNVNTCIVYYPTIKNQIPIIAQLQKRQSYLKALKLGFNFFDKTFDLVHLNAVYPAGRFALYLQRKYKIPYITSIHWSGFLEDNNAFKRLSFWHKAIYRKILAGSAMNLPVSSVLGDALVNLGLTSTYKVFNNSVNEEIFSPIEREQNEVIRFLHISTFGVEVKNTSRMLEAFSKLNRDFILHIVTEFNTKEVIDELNHYQIPLEKCIVESKLNSSEIAAAMNKADAFVLFSKHETFSVVIAEAWMSGLPVITSKCGGLTEQITSKLGRTVPIDDVKALTQELENFSPNDYSKEAIRTFAMQFSRKELKEQLKQIYDSI